MKKILILSIMVIFVLPITSKSNDVDGFGFDFHWSFYWPLGYLKSLPRFACMSFCDSLNGMIGANNMHRFIGTPNILRTTDGGKTWEEVFYDSTTSKYDSTLKKHVIDHDAPPIVDISYIDTTLCVALMSNLMRYQKPYFVTSRDKGNTWSFTYLPDSTLFNGVTFNKNKQGFIFDEGKYLFTTTNSGKIWNKLSYPDSITTGLWDINKFNDSTLLLYAYNYIPDGYHQLFRIEKTTDNGKIWEIHKCPENILGQKKLCFIDENEGWFGGYGSVNNSGFRPIFIYHTTNAGKTWEKQLDTVNYRTRQKFWPISLKFYDKLNGIFASFNSDVYLTTDGGKNWVLQAKNIRNKDGYLEPTHFIDVCFVNKNIILGVTERGMIARYDRNKIEGVEDEPLLWNNTQNLIIYPNPIEYNNINLKLSLKSNSNIKIDLINSLGIIVGKSFTDYLIPGTHTIQYKPDANLPRGTYWLRMTMNNKETIVKPVVIMR